jgi:hypothetical protein
VPRLAAMSSLFPGTRELLWATNAWTKMRRRLVNRVFEER